jgi:hypothetical protein
MELSFEYACRPAQWMDEIAHVYRVLSVNMAGLNQLAIAHDALDIIEVPAHGSDQFLPWNTQRAITVLGASESRVFKVKLYRAGKLIRFHNGKESG